MKIDSPLYKKQMFDRNNSLYLTSKGMLTCGNGKGNKNLAHLQRKIALALKNLDITDPDKLDHLRKNLLQLNDKIDKRNAHIQASWTLWLINFIYSLTVKKISLNPLDTHVKTVLNELKEQQLPITDISLPPCEDEVLSKTVFYAHAENTLTELLIQQKDLEPKYKVEAGDQTFYLSKVFNDGGLRCIGYVQKETHVEPRLFYFCPHRHLWKVAPKVTGNYLGQGRFRVYNELNKLWIVVFPFTTNLCHQLQLNLFRLAEESAPEIPNICPYVTTNEFARYDVSFNYTLETSLRFRTPDPHPNYLLTKTYTTKQGIYRFTPDKDNSHFYLFREEERPSLTMIEDLNSPVNSFGTRGDPIDPAGLDCPETLTLGTHNTSHFFSYTPPQSPPKPLTKEPIKTWDLRKDLPFWQTYPFHP